eukprot:g2340.t1
MASAFETSKGSELSEFSQRFQELAAFKQKKLREQKEVAKELQGCLDGDDGLINSSRRVIKNLDAAIVASRQPGYFKYYEKTANVKKMESSGEVNRLNQKIQAIQREIDATAVELERMEEERRNTTHAVADVGSLSNWFAKYGRPSNATPGKVSAFKASTKIYSATRHHPAFKSVARTMTRGRYENILNLIYLANDALQKSRAKRKAAIRDAFSKVLHPTLKHAIDVGDHNVKTKLKRVVSIWRDRSILEDDVLDHVENLLGMARSEEKGDRIASTNTSADTITDVLKENDTSDVSSDVVVGANMDETEKMALSAFKDIEILPTAEDV